MANPSPPVGASTPRALRYNRSIAQIAEEFGVNPKTVRRWIAENRISAQRVGPRLIRLDADEVRERLLGDVGGAA